MPEIAGRLSPRKVRVCRQCGQRVAVVDGRWVWHSDPGVVPTGSSCDRAEQPYVPYQKPSDHVVEWVNRGY